MEFSKGWHLLRENVTKHPFYRVFPVLEGGATYRVFRSKKTGEVVIKGNMVSLVVYILFHIVSLIKCSVTHFSQVTGFDLYHSYVLMNVTNRNQSLVKSEIRHYFIRLTI